MNNPEQQRLEEASSRAKHWRRWGPYLAERQWGTVREDYSADGDAWNYVTHDMARAYAYRWGEDGLAGISDNHQRLCFAIALWNGRDPILKERLFGLANEEGNHGEDVKEYYWYLDGTPTHSYMVYLYRYPQAEFPYEALTLGNRCRTRREPELELVETGVFDEHRFFDVRVTYAKADADDIVARIDVTNAGPDAAVLHLLPTAWCRNIWRWTPGAEKPVLAKTGDARVGLTHPALGRRSIAFSESPRLLFTENETNAQRLFGAPNAADRAKDAFHDCVILGDESAVADDAGTKCAAHYAWTLEPGETRRAYARIAESDAPTPLDTAAIDAVIELRAREADTFYRAALPDDLTGDRAMLARRALAGLMWSQQWYHYVVETWIAGDPAMPPPPESRAAVRNSDWTHLYSEDILLMPDKWEYPWFAVWDSAFHTVALALADSALAKSQLRRFTREWYMHPNGQLPAYEWNFCDVNPPVHAWAALRLYRMEKARTGKADTAFLESVFHKLLMNFTWWVNRKDPKGNNLFHGGFLGMDNIGAFDRSAPLPTGGHLEQSDGTSWMAMYCLDMLAIAWELSRTDLCYEDIASKFFEHFLRIADAIHNIEGKGESLWDDTDGFFYDQLHWPDGRREPLRVRSMVGLIPLLAVEIVDHAHVDHLPGFRRRLDWFYEKRADLTRNITCVFTPGSKGRCLLSLLPPDGLRRLLAVMLDPNEFLSEYGIRSLSRFHEQHPYVFAWNDYHSEVGYEPGESRSPLFGGNSNWRGPVWFPVNFLLIDALRRYHDFYGDDFRVECPTGSGVYMTLDEVADEIARRLVSIFERKDGRRPMFGDVQLFQNDPGWHDLPFFHEFFHGETGAGLGASHQTGWTALLANLIVEPHRRR